MCPYATRSVDAGSIRTNFVMCLTGHDDDHKRFLKFPMGTLKGVWWMPWLEKAMKDAAWRRYASGRCRATFDPKMSEWGNPVR